MKFNALRTALLEQVSSRPIVSIKMTQEEALELLDDLNLSHRLSFSRWMARSMLKSGLKELETLKTKPEKHKKMVELLEDIKEELGL